MLIIRIIVGLIILALCVGLMKYSVQVTDFTGKIEMAEKYLAPPLAGTYTFYKIFGVVFMALTIAWMFGWFKFLPF